MKHLFLTFLFFSSLFVSAQMSVQWNNNFCCFDSVAPHSFSTPLGVVQMNDTIVLGYWEDGFFSLEFFKTVNGQFTGGNNFTVDTINPPLYYGGCFKKLVHGYAFLGIHSDNFANTKLILQVLDGQFSPLWTNSFPLSSFQFPPSEIKVDTETGNYLFASISDSLHVYGFSPFGNILWDQALEIDSVASLNKELFQLSDSTIVVCTLEHLLPSTTLQAHFRKFDLSDGHFIQDLVYPDLAGINHRFFYSNDVVCIAFQDAITNEILVKQVDLISGTSTNVSTTGTMDASGLQSIDMSPNWQYIYIWSNSHFLQLTSALQVNYSRQITNESFAGDNSSHILFDQVENPLLSFSYINNMITNHDLMILRLDRLTGSTLDSVTYNDARNTSDHAMDQYIDVDGNLNVVFANDFDNFAILHEETQLGVLQLNGMFLNIPPIINSADQLVLYPNPGSARIYLKGNYNENNLVQIIDLSGRILKEHHLENNEISIQELQSGTYLFRILDEKKFPRCSLFIKNN